MRRDDRLRWLTAAPYRHYTRKNCRGGSAPRCGAWQVAHAESFACRGSVRGTVRGRAAHPARCPYRAAITHAHYTRNIRTRYSPAVAHRRALPVAARHHVGARHLPPHNHGAQNVCGSTLFDRMLKRFRTKQFHPPDEPGKKVFHFALSQRRKPSAVLFRLAPRLARPLPETVPQPSTKKLPESFRNALEPVPISYRLSSWPRSSPCRYCTSARTSPADNATHGQSSNR